LTSNPVTDNRCHKSLGWTRYLRMS